MAPEVKYSIGLHPWYINTDSIDAEFENLKKYAALENVIAIGECGLDKVRQTEWKLQGKAFKLQIELANQVSKPLIIHCVRAYDEVLKALNDNQVRVPVIFHGFNKKLLLAEQLLKEGYYLSFGGALLNEQSNACSVFLNLPVEQIFLETDSAAVSIEEIYYAAALLRKTSLDTLILQLQKNYETVFIR